MALKTKLLNTAYRSGAFTPFHWFKRQKLLILTYHRFSLRKENNKLSADEFAAHLGYLKKHTNVISLSEAIELRASRTRLPPNAAVITVDDGYRDSFDVAYPILSSFGFPATLFAVADFVDGKCWLWTDLIRFVLSNTKKTSLAVEFGNGANINLKWCSVKERSGLAERINAVLKQLPKYRRDLMIKQISDLLEIDIPRSVPTEYASLTWQQAREMETHNIQIESHTATHPILTCVGESDLNHEVRNSKELLERELGKTVKHFCYPNGDFNPSVKKSVAAAGYRSAVTTQYGFNNGNEDPYALKRIGGARAIEHFAQSVSGFESAKLRVSGLKNSE